MSEIVKKKKKKKCERGKKPCELYVMRESKYDYWTAGAVFVGILYFRSGGKPDCKLLGRFLLLSVLLELLFA